MLENTSVFKSWVPNWAIIGILFFCILHSMALLGIYSSNITYASSFLDVEPEDLQFAMSVTYGTLVSTVLISSRFSKFFPTKKYLIVVFCLIAITIMLSAYVTNFALFIIIRMAEGFLMALPGGSLRQLLITRFKSKNATIIGFTFNYGALLLASPIIVNVALWFLENYDWRYMAYASALSQVACVLLILTTFNNSRINRKIPLYQIDWTSFILLLLAILCGAYFFVYGEKKYWFQSFEIQIAMVVFLIFIGLFIFRQLHLKRPNFDLNVFRYANLRTGVLLLFLFYLGRATLSACHSTMLTVWNWDPVYVAHIQFLNSIGNVIGLVLSAIFLAKTVASKYIFMLGFFIIAVFHLWFTFLFVPDGPLSAIAIPYTLQGVGIGILFVPLVLFTTSSVPTSLAPFSAAIGVAGRFWGSTIGFSVMQNTEKFFQKSHFTKLTQYMAPENMEAQSRIAQTTQSFIGKGFNPDQANLLAMKQISGAITKQSFLLSNMEIFTIAGYGFLIVVVFLGVNQHLKRTYNVFKNRVWNSF